VREFKDVKKRDVIRAFATIRLAMEEKCDRLTDWTDQGNALEQALSLRMEENVTKGLNFVERFLLGTREGASEEGRSS
jgi:hypothetical protein